MSFWPFPKTLLAELHAALAVGPAVEIGSGDGQLAARLESAGVTVLRGDIDAAPDLRLDATALPFANSTLGVVVMGNLLRHLPSSGRRAALVETARVLGPGGVALLLEDHPEGLDPAETNYRRMLDLLAQVIPTRGVAIDLFSLFGQLRNLPLDVVLELTLSNEERPLRPELPLDWILAGGGAPAEAVEQLRRDVRAQGMEYGRFQAVLLRRAKGSLPA